MMNFLSKTSFLVALCGIIGFQSMAQTVTVQETRPDGIIDGVNYELNDGTSVTLSLWAPQKSSVYVLGDFNGWEKSTDFKMKQDGEHFWLKLTGLTPQIEYGYQYLVDESTLVADPFTEKILDPDDSGIPTASYPDLKDRKSTRLNSSHTDISRMPSSA